MIFWSKSNFKAQKTWIFLVFAFFAFLSSVYTQSTSVSDSDVLIKSIIEEYLESLETANELDFNTLSEQLAQVLVNPYDINQVTRQELEELIILSDAEINGFLTYRNKFGPFASIYELQAIPNLSVEQIGILRYLFYIDQGTNKPSTSSIMEESDVQLYLKWRSLWPLWGHWSYSLDQTTQPGRLHHQHGPRFGRP